MSNETAKVDYEQTCKEYEYRLKKMSTPEVKYITSGFSVPIENTCFLHEQTEETVINGIFHVKGLGIYELTEYGTQVLENYLAAKHSARKDLWLKNAWIPIIVSFVTSKKASSVQSPASTVPYGYSIP